MAFDWGVLGLTAAKALAAYALLIVLVRFTGNRTLAKLRAFDFVVTIALGSTLATTVLGTDAQFFQGLVALAALVLLQFAVAWTAARHPRAAKLVTNDPMLLYHDGEFLRKNLRTARVTDEEVRSAMRSKGHGREEDVQTVILETNGELAVLPQDAGLAAFKGKGK